MVVTMRHLCLHCTENLELNLKECLKIHCNAHCIHDKWNGKEKTSKLFLRKVASQLQAI